MLLLETSCQTALALVYATAALGKARPGTAFDGFVASLPAFGLPARAAVAASLVLAEASTVLLLCLCPRVGFVAAAALMSSFTVGVVATVQARRQVACHCFGAAAVVLGRRHIVRNLILVALAVAGALATRGAGQPSLVGERAAAGLLGLVVGALIIRWDDVVFLAWNP